MNLRSAAQRLTRSYDDALASAGITASQFSLLNLVRTIEAPTVKDLSRASGLDRSTLGRNLRVLEREKLIAIAVGSDARTREISLTKGGRQALSLATPLWQEVQDSYVARLGPEKRSQLKDLLKELTAEA
jgi:DNA-binding MarR family transcriptional regulator